MIASLGGHHVSYQAFWIAKHEPDAGVPMADAYKHNANFQHGDALLEDERAQVRFDALPNCDELRQSQHPHEPQEANKLHHLRELGHLRRARGRVPSFLCEQVGKLSPRDGAREIDGEPSPQIVSSNSALIRDELPRVHVWLFVACSVCGEKTQEHVRREEDSREPQPKVVEEIRIGIMLVSHLTGEHHCVNDHQQDDGQVPSQPSGPVWIHRSVYALADGLLEDVSIVGIELLT
mmetsp:Transcript_7193/g.13118  ORF Transcript_7193/g.13118 Transcript_7193/m.13118 type:complete len:235 (+) Transcript_7193:1041-1745(+)